MVLNGSVVFNNIMPNNLLIKKAAIGRPDKCQYAEEYYKVGLDDS